MATTSQLRSWWAGYRCNTSTYGRVSFPGVGREWSLWVAAPSRGLWEAFVQVMRDHQYLFRESAGGTYNCRRIAGSSSYSLHAYAIALDLNPSKNPYGTSRTDQPAAFRNAIKAVRVDGEQAFTWGGDWRSGTDPMHWQINVSPATASKYQTGGDDVLRRGQSAGAEGVDLQHFLNRAGFTDDDGNELVFDGIMGDKTFQAFNKGLAFIGRSPNQGEISAWNVAHIAMRRGVALPDGTGGMTQTQADARYAAKTHPHTAETTVS